MSVVVIEINLACVRFPSRCNVVFGNALVIVREGKLACVAFLHGVMYFLA